MVNGEFLMIQWPTPMHMWVMQTGLDGLSIATTEREQMKLGSIELEKMGDLGGDRYNHISFYTFIKFSKIKVIKNQKHIRVNSILKSSNYTINLKKINAATQIISSVI